jgi:hypothetical protein
MTAPARSLGRSQLSGTPHWLGMVYAYLEASPGFASGCEAEAASFG